MSKVRINDLARELEVKSRPILDALEAIGVTGKTHSSSIEADQAEKVRSYLQGGGRSQGGASRQATAVVPRIDLSKAAKPGDAVRAILERKQAEAAVKAAPPQAFRPVVAAAPPAGAVAARPAVAAAPPAVSSAPVAAPAAQNAPAAQPSQTVAAAPTSAPSATGATTQGAPVRTAPGTPAAPAPRRIVPLPRQGANIVAPAPPAIASRPPSGAVIARPPAPVPADG